MAEFEEIQRDYVSELLSIRPMIEKWWCDLGGIGELSDDAPEEVRLRWPTLWSGHPRILAIFSKYFVQVNDLNEEIRGSGRLDPGSVQDEGMWGPDGTKPMEIRRPVDVLIHEIAGIDKLAHRLVEGIVFIPVGLDMNDEAF